jgi:hypothetical protein
MKCRLWLVGLLAVAPLAGGAYLRAAEKGDKAAALPKSVTVFPVVITPSENFKASFFERVAEVAATLLESAGMQEIEVGEEMFWPPETDEVEKIATEFGKFASGQKLKTEYALFGQIVGTPKTGPREIRVIVVDKTGKVIFVDRADEKAFSRATIKPDCPMTCTVFLVNRLNRVWDLNDPLRKDAPRGKMAQRLARRSGLPPKEELTEIGKRLEVFKEKIETSKVTVYPIHLWHGSGQQPAVKLAGLFTKQGICQAKATETDPRLRIKGDPNEQKVLWDTARAFRGFLRKNPPATDYALLADYAIGNSRSGETKVGHVHLIVCDRQGDWVLVDYQNSHHADFQEIDPRSHNDCNRLAARRLKSRLSE